MKLPLLILILVAIIVGGYFIYGAKSGSNLPKLPGYSKPATQNTSQNNLPTSISKDSADASLNQTQNSMDQDLNQVDQTLQDFDKTSTSESDAEGI